MQLTQDNLVDRVATMDLGGEYYQIPAYFKPRSGAKKLLVLLPGAIDRTDYDVVFQRASWADSFDAHVLALADPTILATASLQLGWFQGSNARPMYAQLAFWIRGFGALLGIDIADVLLFGSSAGGFAGLKLAELLDAPSVVAINPQVYLDRYAVEHYEAMLAVSYAGLRRDEVESSHYAQLSVSPAVLDRVAPTLVVVNTYDVLHLRSHVLPLTAHRSLETETLDIEGLRRLTGFHSLVYSDISRGHVPPDRETETAIICAALGT